MTDEAKKRSRKGVRAKGAAVVSDHEVAAEPKVGDLEATTPVIPLATLVVDDATDAADSLSAIELGIVSVAPRTHALLREMCARASTDSLYTVEQAAADILDAWVDFHHEDGVAGVGQFIGAPDFGGVELYDPEFEDAFVAEVGRQ
jgi:hypothetical protein